MFKMDMFKLTEYLYTFFTHFEINITLTQNLTVIFTFLCISMKKHEKEYQTKTGIIGEPGHRQLPKAGLGRNMAHSFYTGSLLAIEKLCFSLS